MFDDNLTKGLNVSEWVNIRTSHLSYLFQELRLFPELTALENVEIKITLQDLKVKTDFRMV